MKAVQLVELGQPLVEVDLPMQPLAVGEVEVRVEAAGICRSDVHYRSGSRPVGVLPLTPGHEIAGVVASLGPDVDDLAVGDRVAIHYLVSCGECDQCLAGREQFCETGEMFGLNRDGGYAESVVVPARNAHLIPESIPAEIAAVMMCSSSTSLHALRKGRFTEGESVAVVGCGGLGMSAIKIAQALGASQVYGVDIDARKLEMVEHLGAVPVRPEEIGGLGVDVALELVGLPETMRACVDALGIQGRAVAVGLAHEPFQLHSFNDLVLREAEVIGASDHFGTEIGELFDLVVSGRLDLSDVVTGTVPLEAGAINDALDRLEAFDGGVRTVILP
ncbi:MAG: zinc-binding dehydrogenase [Actinomycetota bacterium]|nr:zinc-binding dehydrogenase [Actinomycetota bacterium]